MKKLLIAGGCSYTVERINRHDGDNFPAWPELFAEKLDMNFLNLGKPASGNEYIFSS